MATYEYTPLDKERSEIRLITLLPPRFGREIHIKLETTVLSDSRIPQYHALSYTWGSKDNRVRIWVEGARGGSSSLDVTRDLEEALQHLRYNNGRSRKLWIDAICISQHDIPERNHQVTRMADIYSSATRVIVWLGPKRDGSGTAIEALTALGSEMQVDWPTTTITPLSGEVYDEWVKKPLPFTSETDDEILLSIANLLKRAWFTRLWIWQEVRLAENKVELRCGHDSMPWDNFRNGILCLQQRDEFKHSKPLGDLLDRILPIISYDRKPLDWYSILDQTTGCQCTDDKDKVYALLSLVHPDDRRSLEPDYSKSTSTSDVYKQLFIHDMEEKHELLLLSHCELGEERIKGLPSWVPDLSQPKKCDTESCSTGSVYRTHAVVQDNSVLIVDGLCVGEIRKIETIPLKASTDMSRQALQIWQLTEPKLKEKKDYVCGGSMIEALCCTLCCNEFSEIYSPSMQSYPDFEKSQDWLLGLTDTENSVYEDYQSQVLHATKARKFFTTKEGSIGLAPAATKSGDRVCILLGCRNPMVFRPNKSGSYKVVGACYVHGMADGEAFSGPMPSVWRRVWYTFPKAGIRRWVLINNAANKMQVEDPRLESLDLPSDWRLQRSRPYEEYENFVDISFSNSNNVTEETGVWYDPRMSLEALKKNGFHLQRERGVQLQKFRLV
ncbi:hypothetical protein IMSHALPRED_003398 [Imshaugia aleurites]|uniref:Heterokaryon incompatibility domain-containing protein n=1 Tax=Imshaugia aleurites TaxID=172621 RepID=A0A8H3J829_9LECA|nr:hypothetical protein IMSHALPRED_003398 [Imshaugia aleurites]